MAKQNNQKLMEDKNKNEMKKKMMMQEMNKNLKI